MEAMVRDCAAAGLRVTPPRRAILVALHEATAPTDAVTLMRLALRVDGSVRIGTVYRFLRDLERLHLVATLPPVQGRLRWHWPGRHPLASADERPAVPAVTLTSRSSHP